MTENEAKAWAALAKTYEECARLAAHVWDDQLAAAMTAQQTLAETMRDRAGMTVVTGRDEVENAITSEFYPRDIPVPLFTPRDRLQFLKEVSVTLLIEASKRGLSVTEPEDVGPPVVPFGKQKGTPIEKVPGIDLESMVSWCQERPDRSAKYADFMAAVENELQQRAAKTEQIQTQPLEEKPLALQTEDRP
jgi:hypothetical protein